MIWWLIKHLWRLGVVLSVAFFVLLMGVINETGVFTYVFDKAVWRDVWIYIKTGKWL